MRKKALLTGWQPFRLPNLYLLMSKGTQNHPQVDLCGIRRAATLNGRSKIGPILPPVPGALRLSGFFLRKDRECGKLFCAYKRDFRLCEKREKERARTGIRAPGTVCLQTRAVARRHEGRCSFRVFRTPGGFYAAFCRFKKRLKSDDRNGRRKSFY